VIYEEAVMSNSSRPVEPKVLLDGLVMVESPRWHDGRLWFAHWGTGEIVAVDLDGKSEIMGHGPEGLGWTIDWLPDGRRLVTGEKVLCVEPDGSAGPYADLSDIGELGWNDIVVDGRGNVYVTSIAFDYLAGNPPPTRESSFW
jgi:sugar lactone lactonase YvrE